MVTPRLAARGANVSEATTGVKWESFVDGVGVIYRGDAFTVRIRDTNWWVFVAGRTIADNYATDFATAKRDAERWIMEREGRLPTPAPAPAPAPATDGGGWIACSERMPEVAQDVEVMTEGYYNGRNWVAFSNTVTRWRPIPVDPHAVAACLFDVVFMSPEKAIAAARHVAGCEVCRAKLEAKGGK